VLIRFFLGICLIAKIQYLWNRSFLERVNLRTNFSRVSGPRLPLLCHFHKTLLNFFQNYEAKCISAFFKKIKEVTIFTCMMTLMSLTKPHIRNHQMKRHWITPHWRRHPKNTMNLSCKRQVSWAFQPWEYHFTNAPLARGIMKHGRLLSIHGNSMPNIFLIVPKF